MSINVKNPHDQLYPPQQLQGEKFIQIKALIVSNKVFRVKDKHMGASLLAFMTSHQFHQLLRATNMNS